ncbi:ABC transporter ATP-binding protein [Rhodobacteraceae bacterium CCMM004]|nr:ABC transporter ATP-binding protein [Rhodobacteraceae bacterium CCMM004]
MLREGGTLRRRHRPLQAVRPTDLVLERNGILGLVGESGSGKTTTGMMALRLVNPSGGRILLEGDDITDLGVTALKPYRRRMQVVFQDSYSALDPMFTLQQIVAEPLVIHGIGDARSRAARALEWLERVGLHRSYGSRYPHELSGGQRQRVAIARALILEPAVLVADEPTSALDVSVKAQIINLLQDLQADMDLSILFISHDLSVVRSLCDRVAVMFNGRIVEEAEAETIFTGARHPYTRALLDAIPVLDPRRRRTRIFRDRDAIEAEGLTLAAGALSEPAEPSDEPALVAVAPRHRVEAVVTP